MEGVVAPVDTRESDAHSVILLSLALRMVVRSGEITAGWLIEGSSLVLG